MIRRNRLPFFLPLFLLLLALGATRPLLAGISPSALEINLGPFPVDRYLDPSPNNGILPACGHNDWSVRTCITNAFTNSYIGQGVTGVRFFYALGGGFYSTPFHSDGTLQAAWGNNMAAFLSDLKSFGIQRVTPTAVFLGNWSGTTEICDGCKPLVTRAVTSCGVSKNLNFFPWVPFGFETGNGYPDSQDVNDAYNCAAATPSDIFWGWQPYFTLVDSVLANVQAAGLAIDDYDMENEINLMDFTVEARLIYDPTHSVDVLSSLRYYLSVHGFDWTRATFSVPMSRPNYAGFHCGSVYGDSALLMNESEMTAAMGGAAFGLPSSFTWTNNLPCGGTVGSMITLPISYTQPSVIDIHDHICVEGNGSGSGSGCNAAIDATSTAQTFYNDVWSFLVYRNLTADQVVFGETNSDQNCDGLTQAMAAENAAGYQSSTLWANHAASTALRPWNNEAAASCYVLPSYLLDAYAP